MYLSGKKITELRFDLAGKTAIDISKRTEFDIIIMEIAWGTKLIVMFSLINLQYTRGTLSAYMLEPSSSSESSSKPTCHRKRITEPLIQYNLAILKCSLVTLDLHVQ